MKKNNALILFLVVQVYLLSGMEPRVHDITIPDYLSVYPIIADTRMIEFSNQTEHPIGIFYYSSNPFVSGIVAGKIYDPCLSAVMVMPYEDSGQLGVGMRPNNGRNVNIKTDIYLATKAGIFVFKNDTPYQSGQEFWSFSVNQIESDGNTLEIQTCSYNNAKNIVVVVEPSGIPKILQRSFSSRLSGSAPGQDSWVDGEVENVARIMLTDYVTQDFIDIYVEYIKSQLPTELQNKIIRYYASYISVKDGWENKWDKRGYGFAGKNFLVLVLSKEVDRNFIETIIDKANKYFTQLIASKLIFKSKKNDITKK